ncbi:MAG: GAF domain-containing protein [Pseudomonadota bacterium]
MNVQDHNLNAAPTGDVLADPARLVSLRRSGQMDSAAEAEFDRITTLARRLTGRPISLLSLVDTERQFFKSMSGLTGEAAEARQTPLSHSFCQHVVRTGEPLVVSDARTHPVLKTNLAITDLDVIAYLGIPVRGDAGEVLGSLCVIDTAPYAWTDEDVANMTDLAGMTEDQLALQSAINDRELLVREMLHRAGNRMATISAVVRMAGREANSAEEATKDILKRLEAMSVADRMIQPITKAQSGTESPKVELEQVIEPLLSPYRRGPNAKLWLRGPAVMLGGRATTSFALVFQELIVNSAKYGALGTPATGTLLIAWEIEADTLVINWAETGRAEKPHLSSSTGFGSKLLSLCIEHQLGGTFQTDLDEDGIRHRIVLPLSGIKS